MKRTIEEAAHYYLKNLKTHNGDVMAMVEASALQAATPLWETLATLPDPGRYLVRENEDDDDPREVFVEEDGTCTCDGEPFKFYIKGATQQWLRLPI